MSSAGKVRISWRLGYQQTNDIFFIHFFFFSFEKQSYIEQSKRKKGNSKTQSETEGKMHGTKKDKEKKQASDLCNVQNSKIQSSSILNIPLSRPRIGFDNAYVVSSTTWLSSCINFGLPKETTGVETTEQKFEKFRSHLHSICALFNSLLFYNKMLEFEERRIVFRNVRGSVLLLNSFSE